MRKQSSLLRVFEVRSMDDLAIKRFWSKVNKEADGGCWEWTGALTSAKYGNVGYQGKNFSAHRISYTLVIGVIPEGLVLDHLCMNRKCVNPSHLEAVTHRENILRAVTKTHCPHGHLYDEDNTYYPSRGSSQCRTCNRERGRINRARKKAANE
jgi:hypothetical protein